MAQKVRTLRHWKQRYNKNAKFIFRRPIVFGGVDYKAGDPIPKELENNPAKVRRFWESQAIELAEFEAPNVATGQPEPEENTVEIEGLPEGIVVRKTGGPWFEVTDLDGDVHKVKGNKALEELVQTLCELYAEPESVNPESEPKSDDWLNDGSN